MPNVPNNLTKLTNEGQSYLTYNVVAIPFHE
jgi:hypothetical protein